VEGGSTMSHALQGEINFIVETIEEHILGDNIYIENVGIDARLVYVQKFNEWIFMNYKTNRFINDWVLEDLLSKLSDEMIKELHEVILKEYAL
jgi:hypothetical protein